MAMKNNKAFISLIISGTVFVCATVIMIGGYVSGAFDGTSKATPRPTAAVKAAKTTTAPTKEPTISKTLEPTIKPTDTPTPKPTAKAAEHTKNPNYKIYTESSYYLNIPYPETFEIFAVRDEKDSLVSSDKSALNKISGMLVGSSDYSEVVFAAKNSTASSIMWVSVTDKKGNEELKSVYENHMRINGGSWDGSCGGDFFYYSSTNGSGGNGNTHYCYCKSRGGRYYAINILYPAAKGASVYAPGPEEGYPYELYIRFKEKNFD